MTEINKDLTNGNGIVSDKGIVTGIFKDIYSRISV